MIFLLAGMMIIANVLRRSGVFDWIAIAIVRRTDGRPLRILLLLCTFTAVASAVLDNVTTVVLLVPITLRVAHTLGVRPIPFLIAEIPAANIGGAATLIGDPPNIIIGSASGLDFLAFLLNLGPPVLLIYPLFLGLIVLFFRRDLRAAPRQRARARELQSAGLISDRRLLIRGLGVLGAVLAGFLLHGLLHLEAATIALSGAVVLALISRQDVHELLHEVEWATLLFFVGLFMLVEALTLRSAYPGDDQGQGSTRTASHAPLILPAYGGCNGRVRTGTASGRAEVPPGNKDQGETTRVDAPSRQGTEEGEAR